MYETRALEIQKGQQLVLPAIRITVYRGKMALRLIKYYTIFLISNRRR